MALAHVAVRVAVSPALKWDEAEQMLWSQQLALGSQPPLYTWLQWLANQVFGPACWRCRRSHALLALSFALMYLAGRELLDERGAFWASASMLLLPPLGWAVGTRPDPHHFGHGHDLRRQAADAHRPPTPPARLCPAGAGVRLRSAGQVQLRSW